jgi:hypothetical protein
MIHLRIASKKKQLSYEWMITEWINEWMNEWMNEGSEGGRRPSRAHRKVYTHPHQKFTQWTIENWKIYTLSR